MIPAEAVEAAAKAMFDVRDDPYDMDEWEDIDSTEREPFVCQARAALEAAAPHIRAQALEDAAEVWGPTGLATWLRARASNERPTNAD